MKYRRSRSQKDIRFWINEGANILKRHWRSAHMTRFTTLNKDFSVIKQFHKTSVVTIRISLVNLSKYTIRKSTYRHAHTQILHVSWVRQWGAQLLTSTKIIKITHLQYSCIKFFALRNKEMHVLFVCVYHAITLPAFFSFSFQFLFRLFLQQGKVKILLSLAFFSFSKNIFSGLAWSVNFFARLHSVHLSLILFLLPHLQKNMGRGGRKHNDD